MFALRLADELLKLFVISIFLLFNVGRILDSNWQGFGRFFLIHLPLEVLKVDGHLFVLEHALADDDLVQWALPAQRINVNVNV